ncbi:MAG: 16S rRNA (cytosine(1402)-N(4))-methyltransferase RsmH [Sporolactobacillus sp.]
MFHHVTVLKNQAVAGLAIKPHGLYVDCTLGGGGHSAEILKQLSHGNGHLFAFDQDEAALNAASERLQAYRNRVTYIKSNFRNLQNELESRDVHQVDGILFDLGVSSPQFDQAQRGFSYQQTGPLDMRMDRDQALDAATIVNEWSYEQLVHIFFMYGEERFSKPIARIIEKVRADHRIQTTDELVELIKQGIPAPARRTGGHPAKRVFQALRIAVNDELGSLEAALRQSIQLLSVGGRLSIITFQSLEDRLCKQYFKKYSDPPELPPGLPVVPSDQQPLLRRINRKPVLPTAEELCANRRAHSAKLRIVEKIRMIKEDER